MHGERVFMGDAKAEPLIEPARAIVRSDFQRKLGSSGFRFPLTKLNHPTSETISALCGQHGKIDDSKLPGYMLVDFAAFYTKEGSH